MANIQIPLQELSALLFIFLRITSILLFLPLFDSRNIPLLFKVGLSLAVSILFLPLLNLTDIPSASLGISFVIGVVSEIMMGIGIGMSVKMIFTGVQLGGQLAGYQMGLAIANVFDPATGSQNSIVAQFKYLAAMLIFLSIDAHHWFFHAIVDSFTVIPPFAFALNDSLLDYFLKLSGDIFIIAVKLSAPIIVVMLFTSAALGLVARTVPQINIFFVAMPIKLMVGIFFIGLMLPVFSRILVSTFNNIGEVLMIFIRLGSNG